MAPGINLIAKVLTFFFSLCINCKINSVDIFIWDPLWVPTQRSPDPEVYPLKLHDSTVRLTSPAATANQPSRKGKPPQRVDCSTEGENQNQN